MWTRRKLNLSLLAAAAGASCAAERSASAQTTFALQRGIGLHLMSWPQVQSRRPLRFVWPPFELAEDQMSDAEMRTLRTLGFDFVRLPVSPEIFMGVRGAQAEELDRLFDRIVARLRAADLKVIVDLHPNWNVDAYNADRIVRESRTLRLYTEVVRHLAARLEPLADGVALEIMNEPPVESVQQWRTIAAQLVDAARQVAPTLPLVVPGHDGDGYEELCAFAPFPASAGTIIYTFHYYEPGPFTHQTQVDAARHIAGLEWPPRPARREANLAAARRLVAKDRDISAGERDAAIENARDTLDFYYERNPGPERIARAFAEVADWADRNSVPRNCVLLGEFGVVRTHWEFEGADEPSRLAYLEAVRRAAEANGFPWSVWTYTGWGGMALTDHDTRAFEPGSARALGLNL